MKVLGIRLKDGVLEGLDELSKLTGLKRSELVRRVLESECRDKKLFIIPQLNAERKELEERIREINTIIG